MDKELDNLYWMKNKLERMQEYDPFFDDIQWIDNVKAQILRLERKLKLEELNEM